MKSNTFDNGEIIVSLAEGLRPVITEKELKENNKSPWLRHKRHKWHKFTVINPCYKLHLDIRWALS